MSIIETTIDAKTLVELVVTKTTEIKTEPKLTSANVGEVIEMLKDIENNNGHMGIAKSTGLSVEQVKKIEVKMQSRIAELTPVEEFKVSK